MTLSLEADVAQLIGWGLCDQADIVRGDLRVASLARRNLSLKIERRLGASYVVKRPDPATEDGARTLADELRFYQFCAEEPRADPVRRLMPPLHSCPAGAEVLVLALVEGGRNLRQEHWRNEPPGLSPEILSDLGFALGTVHATFRLPGLFDDPRLSGFEERPPGALGLHRPHPDVRRDLSSAQLQVLRCLQGEPAICDGLDAARGAWRSDTLIHGDIRSDNVLICDHGSGSKRPILLLDWELVQHGDPAWDLGSALQDRALFWLLSMSLHPDIEPAEMAGTASYPIRDLQADVRRLWRGYVAAAGLVASESTGLLVRAVRFSAARLVLAAWENAGSGERISSLAVLAIQVAANILADPERATRDLFGFGGESEPGTREP